MSDIVGNDIWCFVCKQDRTVDSMTLILSKFDPAAKGNLVLRPCGHKINIEYVREEL